MRLHNKILLPVDVNSISKQQLDTAIALGRSYNSEIIVMSVLPDNILKDSIKMIVARAITDSLNKVIETIRKEGVVTKKPVIVYGKPEDKIIHIAHEENVNLILIGSGNKGKSEKFKLGITAGRLLRLSDIPVWVTDSNDKLRLTNILCPVDFSDTSRRALENAIILSVSFKATLRILAVFEPFINTSQRLSLDEEKENRHRLKQFEQEVDQFIKEFNLEGINHEVDIQHGFPHEIILRTIEEYCHDLLVMGTNGRSGLNRFIMGSVTEKVTREMPCSFITTKGRQ
ncbi:MAG: universal stress protein [Bacteroidales bacterium]